VRVQQLLSDERPVDILRGKAGSVNNLAIGDWLRRLFLYVVLVVLSFAFALPLLWMISTSLKTDPQVYHIPPIWVPNPIRLMNYPEVLTQVPFGLYFLNTLRYALPSVVGVLLSSSLAAYGFAGIRWRGRDALFFIAICTMMVPFQVVMIPLYITFKHLGWLNSYKPLVIPAFFGFPYYIFLTRQFFLTIPSELSDAAWVDGCSPFMVYWRIFLPLSRSVLVVVGLFEFMAAWNNYLGPLIYLNRDELYPVALALRMMRSTFVEKLAWPYLMAASTMVVLPVILIFVIAQGFLVEGIALTGIKG